MLSRATAVALNGGRGCRRAWARRHPRPRRAWARPVYRKYSAVHYLVWPRTKTSRRAGRRRAFSGGSARRSRCFIRLGAAVHLDRRAICTTLRPTLGCRAHHGDFGRRVRPAVPLSRLYRVGYSRLSLFSFQLPTTPNYCLHTCVCIALDCFIYATKAYYAMERPWPPIFDEPVGRNRSTSEGGGRR